MTLLSEALAIAATGWPVFPCGAHKRPCIPALDDEKPPTELQRLGYGRGFHDATVDPDEIALLFAAAGAKLVGTPTGELTGFDVLDIDYRNDGGAWEEANLSRLPETRTHRTLNGGRHYLFRHAPGVRNSAAVIAPGIDIRGDGGYVCLPPIGYTVESDAEIAEWPDWLLALVLARDTAKERIRPINGHAPAPLSSARMEGLTRAIVGRVSSADDGAKHYTLRNAALSLGGLLDQSGLTELDALARLMNALPASVKDEKAARATAIWGLQQGRLRPWEPEDRPGYGANGSNGPLRMMQAINGEDTTSAPTPSPLQPPPVEAAGRPTITVRPGLRHTAADSGLFAMKAAAVPFYQRDRTMVRAAPSKAKTSDGSIIEVPSLLAVSLPMLARALGQCAEWEKSLKDGTRVRIDPPREVVEQIAAMVGEWPFPPVAGVIGTPTMRPDGSLLLTPGYDEATGLVLVSPPAMPDIPQKPTKDQAIAAGLHLNGLLAEFPFASDASRAAALSMLLTPVLRGALGAAVPMHVVAAPQPGSGKSYLQDVASVLATGERCAVITVAPDPHETEKRLIGAALAGFPIIALDNVNGVLTGDFLAQVTERPLLQLRPLGTSGVQRIANVFSVFANGNNIAVAADLARRTVLCALDADAEEPEMRQFDYDPVKMILDNRGSYLADCLTIARAYHLADYPDTLNRVPSFERWSDLVRSALVWLGYADPCGNAEVIKAEDPHRTARAAVFNSWAGPLQLKIGYTLAEIIAVAEKWDGASGQYVWPEFRNALFSVAHVKGSEKIDITKLGNWIRSASNVVIGNRKLLKDNKRSTEWRMEGR